MTESLGATIRRAREKRGQSLKQLAQATGLTQSFHSQVENDRTSPSVASLRKIAEALETSIGTFFAGGTPNGRLVRKGDRAVLIHPQRRWRDSLLTPSLTGKLMVIFTEIEPGGGSAAWRAGHFPISGMGPTTQSKRRWRLGASRS